MPKRATYMLRWLEELQCYQMMGGMPDEKLLQPDNSKWLTWLNDLNSFAFTSRSGTYYTARKEKLQRGGVYWYCYRSHLGKTIKRYIGKPTDLSLARLEEVADLLTREHLLSSSGHTFHAPMSHGTTEIKALEIKHSPTPLRDNGDTPEPFVMPMMPLLISKLHPPHLPSPLIARPDVFARLDTGMAYKLTLLSTPAGFGKTTAVNQWLTEHMADAASNVSHIQVEAAPDAITPFYPHTAWVTLDTGDNDSARFWRYLIAACQRIHSDIGRSALALLLATLQPPFILSSQEMMLTFLLNDITHYVNNGLLILDDYHIITEPSIHNMMTFFLDHLPTSLHILILTRSEPPLPLVRWRANGELHDIQTADLRFSPEETITFLRQALSPMLAEALSNEAIRYITRGMEGWAAGLRLLLLTMPRQIERSKIEHDIALLASNPQELDGYSSSQPQRIIVEYFITEVLDAQPKPLQHFLLQTSILNRLTGSLCDTLTGQQDGGELLRAVTRAGLFLEELNGDESGDQWYRYHSLFAEAMRREALVRLGEEQLRTLAQSASRWYEQHNMLTDAVDSALSAQEFDRAVLLIERLYETLHLYEMRTLLHWIERFPETALPQYPVLYFYKALALLFIHAENEGLPLRTRYLNDLLQLAEEGCRARENRVKLGEIFAFRALLLWWQGEISNAEAYARQALDILPAIPTRPQEIIMEQAQLEKMEWRSVCLTLIGMKIVGEGSLDKARRMLQDARMYSNLSGNKNFTRAVTLMFSLVLLLHGELSLAATYSQQVLSDARAMQDWGDSLNALHKLMGIAYEWNDVIALEQRAKEVEELNVRPIKEVWREMALLYSALLYHLRGETKEAQKRLKTLLAQIELIKSPTVLPLLFDVYNWQIRLHLTLGDLPAAQRSLQALGHHKSFFSLLYHERWQLLQMRLLLAQGEAQAALSQLEALLIIVRSKQRMREVMEIQLLMVLAYAACKQEQEARHLLRNTLEQACRENYLRLFLDEGISLMDVLRSLLPTLEEKWLHTYAQHILTIADEAVPIIPTSTSLSTQERRVLRLLIAGQSNRQIANELVVSVNTIKDHVKNLYRKLDVNNRLEASEAARRMKLS